MPQPDLPEFQMGSLKDSLLSPLSTYYRGKKTISKAGIETQAVLPFVTSSRDKKIVLVKNSKSGCTSLAQAIYTYDTGQHFDGNIHREGRHLRQGVSHWQDNSSLIFSGHAYVISAIRNPLDRIVSAYFDFCVEQRNPMRKLHAESFKAFDIDHIRDVQTGFDRFLDYAEASLERDAWRTDRHWRPQSLNLWTDKIRYTLLMRTDDLTTGFDTLRDALNIPNNRFPQIHSNSSKRTTPFAPTDRQKQRVERLYTADFDLFESVAR